MLKDFQNHPKGREFYPRLLEATGLEIPSPDDAQSPEEVAEKKKARTAVLAFLNDMVANKLPAFSRGEFSEEELNEILRRVQ
jgi:beta-glucosidase